MLLFASRANAHAILWTGLTVTAMRAGAVSAAALQRRWIVDADRWNYRRARKRGGNGKKPGLSDEQTPVLIAPDRHGDQVDDGEAAVIAYAKKHGMEFETIIASTSEQVHEKDRRRGDEPARRTALSSQPFMIRLPLPRNRVLRQRLCFVAGQFLLHLPHRNRRRSHQHMRFARNPFRPLHPVRFPVCQGRRLDGRLWFRVLEEGAGAAGVMCGASDLLC